MPEEIGYPAADRPAWKRLGPAPSTFSGERALDFVLSSRCVDLSMSAGLSTWGTIETHTPPTFFGPAHFFR
mgnify:CR=1 FL=1